MAKIIIIGGGISGIASGIYLLKSGHEVSIIEKNEELGGMVSGYSGKHFFNGSFPKYLIGINKKSELNSILKDLDLDLEDYIIPDKYLIYKQDVRELVIYKDKKLLKEELLKVSFEDREKILEFMDMIEMGKNFHMLSSKPTDLLNPFEGLREQSKFAKTNKIIKKYDKLTIDEYFSSFESEIIKNAFSSILPGDLSISNLAFLLAQYQTDNLGIINYKIIEKLKQNYLASGGKIINDKAISFNYFLKNNIKSVNTKNSVIEGDYFVCAVDPFIVFNDLFNKKISDRVFNMRYEEQRNYPVLSSIVVTLNITSFDIGYERIVLNTEKRLASSTITSIMLCKNVFNQKQNIISCKIMQTIDDYEYYNIIKNDASFLKSETDKIIDFVEKEIKKYYPKSKIGFIDLLLPTDYSHDFGAYKGSNFAFLSTPNGKTIIHNGNIASIKNVCLASQWMQSPGGIMSSMIGGKFSSIRINKKI